MATQPARQKKAPDAHDTYVKKVFRQIPQARAFFRAYLPDDVQALFDWQTLRLESVSFISDELQCRFADLRFTEVRGQGVSCCPCRLSPVKRNGPGLLIMAPSILPTSAFRATRCSCCSSVR